MRPLSFKQVDVFTNRPFFGNAVAVVFDADAIPTVDMQRIAMWTNLSETTFVLKPTTTEADYRLRIFTPREELPFAGHPTVGSAHAVLEAGIAKEMNGVLRQECGAGVVRLRVSGKGAEREIFFQAPLLRMAECHDARSALEAALGGPFKAGCVPMRIEAGPVWIVGELPNAQALAGLQPDMTAVARISRDLNATGLTVFARSGDPDFPVHVRTFAPLTGVPEDPVCGSGNASVAAYRRRAGENIVPGYRVRQGMQVGREGAVSVLFDGDQIEVGGQSVTCVDGTVLGPMSSA